MLSAKVRRRLAFFKILSIVMSSLLAAAALSLVITDFFVPVKYLSAYFVRADKNPAGSMRVTFVDAGYGDCTVVEFPDGKTALIDAGDGGYSSNLSVITALNSRGIDRIDYLVCTSVSDRSCGGFKEIFKYKEVGAVFAPYCPATYVGDGFSGFCDALKRSGLAPVYLKYGADIAGGGDYSFFALSPTASGVEGSETDAMLAEPSKYNIDNASAVLWLEYSGVKILLAGNVNESVQEKLCSLAAMGVEISGAHRDISDCSVIKIPNHGAATAAYRGLYEAFKPETAILSVGANAEGCPNVNAITFAQTFTGGALFRTDLDGDVTVVISDGKYTVEKEKK